MIELNLEGLLPELPGHRYPHHHHPSFSSDALHLIDSIAILYHTLNHTFSLIIMTRNYSTFPEAPTLPARTFLHKAYPYTLTVFYLLLEAALVYTLCRALCLVQDLIMLTHADLLLATPVDPKSKPALTFISSILYFTILVVTDSLLAYRYRRSMQSHRAEVERRVGNVIDAIKTEAGFRDDFCRLLRKEMERSENLEKKLEKMKNCGSYVDGYITARSNTRDSNNYFSSTSSSTTTPSLTITDTNTVDEEGDKSEPSTALTLRAPHPHPSYIPIPPRNRILSTVPNSQLDKKASRANLAAVDSRSETASPFTQQYGERPTALPAYVAQLRSQMLGEIEHRPRPFATVASQGRKADMYVVGEIFEARLERDDKKRETEGGGRRKERRGRRH